jgi:hypothetical protein
MSAAAAAESAALLSCVLQNTGRHTDSDFAVERNRHSTLSKLKAEPERRRGGLYNGGTGSGSRAAQIMADAIESVMDGIYLSAMCLSNALFGRCMIRRFSTEKPHQNMHGALDRKLTRLYRIKQSDRV